MFLIGDKLEGLICHSRAIETKHTLLVKTFENLISGEVDSGGKTGAGKAGKEEVNTNSSEMEFYQGDTGASDGEDVGDFWFGLKFGEEVGEKLFSLYKFWCQNETIDI